MRSCIINKFFLFLRVGREAAEWWSSGRRDEGNVGGGGG
jgi:hypothetical protein